LGRLLAVGLNYPGLGVPFLFSAVLIDQLKGTFNWIKANYRIINKICGILLILIGIAMATGLLGQLLNILS
jgi:cytochrome c-type biogenesis protein